MFVFGSQDEAIKQKEILGNELKCLREELKQIRDDSNSFAFELADCILYLFIFQMD